MERYYYEYEEAVTAGYSNASKDEYLPSRWEGVYAIYDRKKSSYDFIALLHDRSVAETAVSLLNRADAFLGK